MKRTGKLLMLGMCMAGALVKADVVVLATSAAALGANDSVTWGQLGADGTLIPHSFTATSAGSLAVNGNFSTTTGLVAVAGGSWTPVTGVFATNDVLDWAFDSGSSNGTGPLTLTFPTDFGVGAAIQPDCCGQFTAKLELFNGNVSLGFVTRTSDAAGDALYIGALDSSGANVTKAVFSLTAVASNPNSETNNLGDFAIDTLSLVTPVTGTPEPSTFCSGVGALLALYWKLRRGSRRS